MTPSREPARQVDADDVRRQEVDRLPEHPGLGLDAADAPAHDAEPVDHGRVGIGADERVGVVDAVALEDALREVLEVDLVDDADARRHDLEPLERLHAPLEELVPGAVAPELDLHVEAQGVGRRPLVDLDRVVHDEGDGDERLDDLRVPFEPPHGRAHGGEVDEERDPGEVLEDDAGDDEGDLGGALGAGLPRGEGPDVVLLDPLSVAVAQQGLEHDAEARRQTRDAAETVPFELRKRVERRRTFRGRERRSDARGRSGSSPAIVLRGRGR